MSARKAAAAALFTAVTAVALSACGTPAANAFAPLAMSASISSNDAAATASADNSAAQHPRVVSFSTSKPVCHTGDQFADLHLSWKVTGADNATIEIGPGNDLAYPVKGSTTVSFPCDGKPHVYSVWPGGDQNLKKSHTVTAKKQH